MANKPAPTSEHGRTPWDVLLELSRRRSILVWACLLGWALLVGASLAWYHGLLPARGTKAADDARLYLHWSFQPVSASRDTCMSASIRAQQQARPTEVHDSVPSEIVIVGVYDSAAAAVGCAGYPDAPQAVVMVAAPDQSKGQNLEAQLREVFYPKLVP